METRARVALEVSDAREFAKVFVQTLSENKIPVLLPNANPGTLEKLKSEFDWVVSEASVSSPTSLSDLNPDSEIVFYTSGSTGEPKKIVKTLGHLLNEVKVIEKFFNGHARSPIFTTVSHQHIYGLLHAVLWPLLSGREIGSFLVSFPEQLRLIEKEFSDFTLISSPSFLSRLDGPVSNCRVVTSSGALLMPEVAKAAFDVFGVYPHEIFGSTETGGVAWRQQSPENPNGVWTLVDGVRAAVDENSQLKISSPFFAEQEMTMGDYAALVGASQFVLHGRADRIVKIEGKRISLAEIESVLRAFPLVRDAVALDEKTYRDQISLLVVLSEQGAAELKAAGDRELKNQLRRYLSHSFEAVALPKKIRLVDSIPRNSEAKIDLHAIREMLDA